MTIRRAGHREDRRRRVFREGAWNESADADQSQATPDEPARGEATGCSRLYSAAALESNQPPITHLIPQRIVSLLLCWLVGLTALALIEFLYTVVFMSDGAVWSTWWPGLDLQGAGTVAQWFSALLLLLAAAAARFIYWIRRHRLDDYRGRYRVWVWAAVGLLLASVDVQTALHEGLGHATAYLLRPYWNLPPQLCWMVWLGSAVGIAALRLLIEMRRSPMACLVLLVSLSGYGGAAFLLLQGWPLPSRAVETMVVSGLLMTGHLHVAMSLAIYCRRVYQDAQALHGENASSPCRAVKSRADDPSEPRGARPVRAKSRKTKESAASPESRQPSRSSRAEVSEPNQPKVGATIHASNANRESDQSADSTEAEGEPRKLSKAERRRLRKLARRQQRASA